MWVADAVEHRWVPWRQEICDWLVTEGREPDYVFRVEVEVIDAPLARYFEYDRTADGSPFIADDGDLALRPISEQLISSLPPRYTDPVHERTR